MFLAADLGVVFQVGQDAWNLDRSSSNHDGR